MYAMKKIILTLALGFMLANVQAQVHIGVGVSFGYPYGPVVYAPPPVVYVPAPRPVIVPRCAPRVYVAPPVVYGPRYRGWHRGRRW